MFTLKISLFESKFANLFSSKLVISVLYPACDKSPLIPNKLLYDDSAVFISPDIWAASNFANNLLYSTNLLYIVSCVFPVSAVLMPKRVASVLSAIPTIESNIFEILEIKLSNIVCDLSFNVDSKESILSCTLSVTVAKLSERIISLPYNSCPEAVVLSIPLIKDVNPSFPTGIAKFNLLNSFCNKVVDKDNCCASVRKFWVYASIPAAKASILPAPLIELKLNVSAPTFKNLSVSLRVSKAVYAPYNSSAVEFRLPMIWTRLLFNPFVASSVFTIDCNNASNPTFPDLFITSQ